MPGADLDSRLACFGLGFRTTRCRLVAKGTPPKDDRRGDGDGGVRADDDTGHENERKTPQDRAPHREERQDHEQREARRQDGASQRLVDGQVDDFRERAAAYEFPVFAHPIEDDDGVGDGVTNSKRKPI